MKKSIIIIFIIIIAIGIGILYTTGIFNKESNIENNTNKEEEKIEKDTIDYSSFIGTWNNDVTQNEIVIKGIENNKLTFTWVLYRITGLDDITISFENGMGSFYFEGIDDLDDNQKVYRKATVVFTDNGVDVLVEDVDKIDNNYKSLGDIDGGNYIKPGTYSHNNKV